MSINYPKNPLSPPGAARRIALALALVLLGVLANAAAEPRVIGWIEKVLLEEGLVINAKIDTGARHSSLNVTEHKVFRKKGKSWIEFEVTDQDGRKMTIERRIIRYAKIKRKGYRSQTRPVVELTYCLGGVTKTVQVNLVDRTRFDYQMLVGRSFLRGDFVVDPAAEFTIDPACYKKQKS